VPSQRFTPRSSFPAQLVLLDPPLGAAIVNAPLAALGAAAAERFIALPVALLVAHHLRHQR